MVLIFKTLEFHEISADVHNQMGYGTKSIQILAEHSFGLVSCYGMMMLSKPFIDLSSANETEGLDSPETQLLQRSSLSYRK